MQHGHPCLGGGHRVGHDDPLGPGTAGEHGRGGPPGQGHLHHGRTPGQQGGGHPGDVARCPEAGDQVERRGPRGIGRGGDDRLGAEQGGDLAGQRVGAAVAADERHGPSRRLVHADHRRVFSLAREQRRHDAHGRTRCQQQDEAVDFRPQPADRPGCVAVVMRERQPAGDHPARLGDRHARHDPVERRLGGSRPGHAGRPVVVPGAERRRWAWANDGE
jgi:hypothetical protein